MRGRGYRIACTNYSCPRGELDIVATDGEDLVFVEVKTRASNAYGEASAAVTPEKQRRIIAAAEHYLAANPTELGVRFDVVAITGDELLLIRDAFRG